MIKIVILGGGYGGIYALRQLVKNKNIKITLVDKNTFHNLQPEVYDLIANKSNIADVTIDLTTLCYGLKHDYLEFKNTRAEDIDFDKQTVYTSDKESIPYDYLIIGTGSRTKFPKNLNNLKDTNDLKKLNRALFFKQNFETQLLNKITDEAKKCDNTHIVVVGAGLSGVEITAEMAYNSRQFFKRGKFACEDLKISLVTSGDSILPGFSSKMIRASHRRLKSLGINIISNTKLQNTDDDYLYLSNGKKILYSFVIFAGGIESANLTLKLDLEKNHKGQVIVDEYQRIAKYPNVFVVGDAGEFKNTKGEIMSENVILAKTTGILAAKNILNTLQHKKMKKSNPKFEGTLIALGGKYAVCDIYGIFQVEGFLAYLIKKYVFLRYRLPLLRYINAGYKILNHR